MSQGYTMADELAREAAEIDADIEQAIRRQQALQLATSPASAAVPLRFRAAVDAAEREVAACRRALDAAEREAQAWIDQNRPSEPLARLEREKYTLQPANALRAAEQAVAAARLQLGEQVRNYQELAQLEASAPGERQAAAADYQNRLKAIDQRLAQARLRCAS